MHADLRKRDRIWPGGSIVRMLVGWTVVSLGLVGSVRAETLPGTSEVLRRIIERAEAIAKAGQNPQYTYEKRSLFERMDGEGRLIKSEEKLFEVKVIRGLPFNRLVRIQGRDLTEEELRREQARQEHFQQRFVSADRKKIVAQKAALVTPELLDRFQFAVKERILVTNRPTLVLTFKPRDADLPARSLEDKNLNRMAGTLWIDEAEADTVRVEAGLTESLSLGWFGWLGSLTRCQMSLERQRMPEGVWLNTRLALFIQCRKLTTTLRFRTTEESSGFKLAKIDQ